MNTKYVIAGVIIVVLILVSFVWFFLRKNENKPDTGELLSGTTASPSASFSPSPSSIQNGKNIIVFSPKPGEKVDSPITIKGKARVFENTFVFMLRDEKGGELYKNNAMADALDMGQYGNFEVKVVVPVQSLTKVTLEVFDYSAKDGSVENLVSIPLEIATKETMDVNVYLINNKLDPEVTCTKVFPIKRQILKTKEVAYVSLYQLIQGPNMGELGEGYDTSIPGQTRINSIKITNGTAYADFSEDLEYGVAGSCKVTAIRSQIESTLKQFPSIKNVVISIDGRTKDILQP